MKHRPLFVVLLLAGASALLAEDAFYEVDLKPSGKMIARDAPIARGNTIQFHGYPSGTLVSLRKSDVKQVLRINAQSATATNPASRVVSIGNLAMQGGGAQAGPVPAGAAASKGGAQLGKGFYSAVVPGQTQGYPNSPNDYQVGRTYAAPPTNAVQSAPGAPPTNPGATGGANPPTMGSPPQ